MIVDDNKELADALSTEFADLGFLAISAHTAEQGIALLAAIDLDLIIADIQMPGINGLQFVDAIRTKNPKIRVFLITGNVAMASATMSRTGVESVFEKPIDIHKIIQKIGKSA